MGVRLLLLLRLLLPPDPPLFFALQLVVKQEECLLVRLRCANDRKHALTRLIVRCLGNGDLGPRQTTNLGDLGPAAANNAAYHVGRNGDVLRPQIGWLDVS